MEDATPGLDVFKKSHGARRDQLLSLKALRVGPRASCSEASKHQGWSHCATVCTVLLDSDFWILGGSNSTNGSVSGAAYPARCMQLSTQEKPVRGIVALVTVYVSRSI